MAATTIEPQTDFSRRLRDARIAAGYPTATAAANALEMSQPNYWRLEHAAREPGWTLLQRLVGVLRLPLELFFPHELILESAERIRLEAAEQARQTSDRARSKAQR